MDEKKLLEQLKRDAEEITPPESLQPDAIETMLKYTRKRNPSREEMEDGENQETISDNPDLQNETKAARNPGTGKKKATMYRFVIRYGSMAAILLLGLTAVYQSNRISQLSQDKAMLLEKVQVQTDESGDLTAIQNSFASSDPAAVPEASADADPDAVPETLSDNGPDAGSSISGSADSVENTADSTRSASADSAENTSDSPRFSGAGGQAEEGAAPAETEAFTYCESYQQIYDTLAGAFATSVNYDSDGGELYAAAEAEDTAVTREFSTSTSAMKLAGGSGAVDYSQTNIQEQGVDEADIVKTDGEYIYILNQEGSFSIVSAEGTALSTVSVTEPDTALASPTAREMYLDGDTLSIILDGRKTSLTEEDNIYYTSTGQETHLLTYDISDRSQPALKGQVSQEGRYQDSRKVGPYLYLFTSWSPQLSASCQDSTLSPRINGEALPAGSIYLPRQLAWMDYLVISSVDSENPGEVLDQKALVSGADNFYVSAENIYIANTQYSDSATLTEITKFHYARGKITGVAAASVEGYLNNSFSLNEYEGKLRVVSTYYDENWDEWNALYVLDESLNQLGSIRDLAQGETIRSARFLGDTGYFVTFRQTDPLFSVDLSDPANPRILGELKVTGFSSYLHFYGENQLLGIGYEADEDTGVISGLKLSMFDFSDPANVTETHRLILPGITWCPAIEDYKAILVDPAKNLIGFFCDNRYFVYSYDGETGFTRELIYDFYSDGLTADYDTMRGLYIGDTLYLAGETFVIPFDMEEDFRQEEYLSLS